MILLLESLLKFYPDFNHKRFNAEGIFKKTFPDDSIFKESKLRRRMSELVVLIYDYLKLQELKDNEFLGQSLLRQSLAKRSSSDLFLMATNNYQKKLDASPVRDHQYYYEKYAVFHDLYLQSIRLTFSGNQDHLIESNWHLDRFYFMAKLELGCGILSRSELINNCKTLPFFNDILKLFKKHTKFDDPQFKIHLALINLYQEGINDDLFHYTFNLLQENIYLFSTYQQASIIYQLINYTSKRSNANEQDFFVHQIKLFQLGLKEGSFLENGFLPENTFLNISVSFAIAKNFAAIDQLIDHYLIKLPFSKQDQAKKLALAFKYFHQSNFQQTFDIIKNLNEYSLYYKLRIRLLKLRCLYEIQIKDQLFRKLLLSEIKTYESLFKRESEIVGQSIQMYLNFSEALRSIIHRNTTKPISTIKNKLVLKINTYENLVARKWLLDKVKQL